jgi:hypothetical protein
MARAEDYDRWQLGIADETRFRQKPETSFPPSVGRRVLLNHKNLSCLYLQGNEITTIRELAKLSRLPG